MLAAVRPRAARPQLVRPTWQARAMRAGNYKAGQMELSQTRVSVGADSVVGARAAILPGFKLRAGGSLAPVQLGRSSAWSGAGCDTL